jgi:hypothetical protein
MTSDSAAPTSPSPHWWRVGASFTRARFWLRESDDWERVRDSSNAGRTPERDHQEGTTSESAGAESSARAAEDGDEIQHFRPIVSARCTERRMHSIAMFPIPFARR